MIGRRLALTARIAATFMGLFTFVAVPATTSSTVAQDIYLQPQLDELVPALLERNKVPGAVVVAIEGSQTLIRAYGQRRAKSRDATGPDTVFEAASLGKPVLAYAVMERVIAGRFDLDRPLSESLDEPFAEADDRLDRITARHVLSHTTGFPNWRPGRFSAQPGPLEIQRDPGSRFGYSGEGYMYLQLVTERQTGEPLDGFMQDAVFRPLGMARSSYLWSDRFATDLATPHGYWGQAGEKWRAREAGAAYSLHTTAADYARFLNAMLAADNQTAEAMLVPQVELPGYEHLAWSLGWGIERRADGDWFWHWGDNTGYKHFVMGSRDKRRAVLVLTNAKRGTHVYRAVVELVLGFSPEALNFELINY